MDKFPSIKLTAVGSNRRLTLDRLGIPILLVFLWLDTQDYAEVINRAVRKRYPDSSQVMIANVASLRGIPGIFRGLAENEMKKAYREISAQLPKDLDPAEYVIILPDWKGECARTLGLRDLSSQPAVAVIDQEGMVTGVHQGEADSLEEAALNLLERAISAYS
jgi:hypothetical protein